MFGKIINGKLIKAPCRIKYKGRIYHNPSDVIYSKSGYFKIKYQDKPDDGYDYIDYYEQIDNYRIQSWQQKTDESYDESHDDLQAPEDSEADVYDIIDSTSLLQRIVELEEKLEFVMNFGHFKNHWNDHKH